VTHAILTLALLVQAPPPIASFTVDGRSIPAPIATLDVASQSQVQALEREVETLRNTTAELQREVENLRYELKQRVPKIAEPWNANPSRPLVMRTKDGTEHKTRLRADGYYDVWIEGAWRVHRLDGAGQFYAVQGAPQSAAAQFRNAPIPQRVARSGST
jgi:hypothetical protein